MPPISDSKSWPRIIRDPVHRTISFEKDETDQLLLRLIGTREFQRLRRIKQLGMSEYVFPGAVHTRFSHSLGVMHTARRFVSRIDRIIETPLSDEEKTLVLVASLLHDVGHGPFSHMFEKISKEDHEKRTLEIIENSETDIHNVLRDFSVDFPAKVASFFETKPADFGFRNFITEVVSSQLDADRFDYLLRDSLFTGTEYGRFDVNWIIDHLYFSNEKFYLSHKALLPAEQYIFARYHMYRIVYFHKTTRAAEVMLKLLFKRYQFLLKEEDTLAKKKCIVPGAPVQVVKGFSTGLSLEEYLALDDHIIFAFLRACEGCSDKIISSIGSGLLRRKLYKAKDVTDAMAHKNEAVLNFHAAVREKFTKSGYDPEYVFAQDSAADTPYKPYDPADDEPSKCIFVENTLGDIQEITRVSEPVRDMTKKYALLRCYFPEELRKDVEKIWTDSI